MPRLVEARYIRDYAIWLRWNDGSQGEVDLKGELDGPIFEPLKDLSFFKRFTLSAEMHTLVWPNGADLAPEFLREHYSRPRLSSIEAAAALPGLGALLKVGGQVGLGSVVVPLVLRRGRDLGRAVFG
jgi:hypothetical protein